MNRRKVKAFTDLTNSILYQVWDPIRMRGVGPEDEYLGYAHKIALKALDDPNDVEALAKRLEQLTWDTFSMKSDQERCEIAAQLICESAQMLWKID